jgi:hypothetical protein
MTLKCRHRDLRSALWLRSFLCPARSWVTTSRTKADALADAAARLAELLATFAQAPPAARSLDAIAVFQALSRTAASMKAAAVEMHRQEWFDLDGEADPEASAAWNGALEGACTRPRARLNGSLPAGSDQLHSKAPARRGRPDGRFAGRA